MTLTFQFFTVIIGLVGFIIFLLVLLGHFFNKRHLPSTPSDAALVFGTGLAWKAQARCTTAAQLFNQGLTRYIIVSGGVMVPNTNMIEAEWFRLKLTERCIPSDRILVENRAANTAQNVEFSLPIIKEHGFQSIILVMSDFEGIRAHLTAKKAWHGQDIKVYDYHAPSIGYWNPWTWWLTREGRHLTWYTLPRLFRYRLLKYLW